MTTRPFSRDWIQDLILRSIAEPRSAAGTLLSVPLSREILWTWLALVAVLNGLLYAMTIPAQVEMGIVLPGFMHSPILLTIAMAGLMLLMTQFFVMVGRMMGGEGTFWPMLQVTCWLQSLRFLFQLVVTILGTLAPGIGALLAVVGGIWSIYIMVGFLTETHRFSLLKAASSMVIAVIAAAVALSFILALLGASPAGEV